MGKRGLELLQPKLWKNLHISANSYEYMTFTWIKGELVNGGEHLDSTV